MEGKASHSSYATRLLQKLKEQLDEGTLCNLNLQVQDQMFRMHKCVLAANSAMFSSVLASLPDNSNHLVLADMSLEEFRPLLSYMYTGKLDFSNVSPEQILSVAQSLQLTEAEDLCRNYIERKGNVGDGTEECVEMKEALCSALQGGGDLNAPAKVTDVDSSDTEKAELKSVKSGSTEENSNIPSEIPVESSPERLKKESNTTFIDKNCSCFPEVSDAATNTEEEQSQTSDLNEGDKDGILLSLFSSEENVSGVAANFANSKNEKDKVGRNRTSIGYHNKSNLNRRKVSDPSASMKTARKPKVPEEEESSGVTDQETDTEGFVQESPMDSEGSIKCPECPKTFSKRSQLRLHASSHSSKPYKCKICGQGFVQEHFLEFHTQVTHPSTKRHDHKAFITSSENQKHAGSSDHSNSRMSGAIKKKMIQVDEGDTPPMPKRKRGRPPKEIKSVEMDTKQPPRKRGRPPKFEKVAVKSEQKNENVVKRPRGRPRKDSNLSNFTKRDTTVKAPLPPKRRGRPSLRQTSAKHAKRVTLTKKRSMLGHKVNNSHEELQNSVKVSKRRPGRPPVAVKCTQCNLKFIHKSVLLSHMKSDHPHIDTASVDVTTSFKKERVKIELEADDSFDFAGRNMNKKACSCVVCKKLFRSMEFLRRHMKMKHSNRRFKCKLCKKMFASQQSLMLHRSIHEQKLKCSLCDEKFRNVLCLRKHVSEKHKDGKPAHLFSCKRCKKQFIFKSLMLNHSCQNTLMCEKCSKYCQTYGRYKRHLSGHVTHGFSCNICDKVFKKQSTYQKHKGSHDPTSTFTCPLCSQVFPIKKKFLAHLKGHTVIVSDIHKGDVKLFECSICKKFIKGLSYLQRHMRMHRTGKPFTCDECGKQFMTRSNMNRHANFVHHGLRPYTCEFCNKSFPVRSSLVEHMPVHTEETPFQCRMCELSFSTRLKRRNHMIIDHGVGVKEKDPVKCEHCDEMFKNKSSLKAHCLDEHDVGNYSCEICGKILHSHLKYLRHLQYHEKNCQKYVCDVCGAVYSSTCGLKAHMRKHTGEKPFACEFCGRRFYISSSLIEHRKTHTDERNISCDICGERFRFKSSLRAHSRKHMTKKDHICGDCGKSFHFMLDLRKHLLTHKTERPYGCHVCSKRFKVRKHLIRHFQVHSMASKYKCQLCPRTCLDQEELDKHMKDKHDEQISVNPQQILNTVAAIMEKGAEGQTYPQMCILKLDDTNSQQLEGLQILPKGEGLEILQEGVQLVQQEEIQAVQYVQQQGVQIALHSDMDVQSAEQSQEDMQLAEAVQILQADAESSQNQAENVTEQQDGEGNQVVDQSVEHLQVFDSSAEGQSVQQGEALHIVQQQENVDLLQQGDVQYVFVQYE